MIRVGDKIRILEHCAEGAQVEVGDVLTVAYTCPEDGVFEADDWEFSLCLEGRTWEKVNQGNTITSKDYLAAWEKVRAGTRPGQEFTKHDLGKDQWSLVPWEVFAPTVKVLTQGAEKYSKHNWQLCEDTDRYKDALFRHLMAYMSGEKTDEESGQPHLNHVICNCLFLAWFDKQEEKDK
jgi:hypothetical protein